MVVSPTGRSVRATSHDPDWLMALLSCRARHDCDVVIGPVLGELPPGAPEWMTEQFAIVSGEDGDRLHEGITGNAMVSRDVLDRTGISFAEELGGSGGEDQLFFRRLARSGADIRYAAHAVVHEAVPAERATLSYMVRRSFRTGNTLGLLDTRVLATPRSRGERTVKAAGVTVRSALILLLTAPLCVARRARVIAVRALLELARGLGMLVGISGFRLDFYRRPVRFRRWHHPPGNAR
jgi:succinoglycan biosynthesis protein ExoM